MTAATNRGEKSRLWSELMERAQQGDRDAFHTLFNDVGPLINRFVTRRIREPNEVEDVCQEILLAVYQSRHTFQPTRPLEPWLFAIAHNVCADHNQRHWARVSRQKPIDDLPDSPSEGEAAVGVDLRRALGRLSPSQLQALRLTKIEGLSLAEVSEKTGDSVGSLKVRVHRAYELLKKVVSQ
ncbi:MAG TPA: RNA polymerase sigma factor [Candidatus Binataceae bacterium]|nr:RNA polymerase sigma factor [Candidatus Binataceae bacterium]